MVVPSQKQLHRPILEIVDGAEEEVVSRHQIKESLIERFSPTDNDLLERVPSGQQTKFDNRVYWATWYLKRAGLLDAPSRSRFQITPQGREILATCEGVIENKQLAELFEARRQEEDPGLEDAESDSDALGVTSLVDATDIDATDVTPDEQIAGLHRELNDRLADDLLESVKVVSADGFERLVVRLLEGMEYGEGQRVGGSGDQGIDGIINQDPLGLEKVYIQAKRWQNQVGEPEIRNFCGSLIAKGANKGVFITTSRFSSTARETARIISAGNQFIRLIDGRELARLMITHDVGVITEITYPVKKLDENYFAEDL